MDSKKLYEHAQNLLGGVKKELGILNLGGKRDIIIIKSMILVLQL